MASNVECEVAERDEDCACREHPQPSLDILKEVHRVYEERMQLVERVGGDKKLQMQAEVLRSWVSDLVGQNTLLVRAVEELEAEATNRLHVERIRHLEMVCELRAEGAALRRRLARKDSDLRGLLEVLRRLREFDYCTLDGIHFFEVTESDIFGSFDWREKKLEQGDSTHMKLGYSARNHTKHDKKRKLCDSWNELKILNDSLQKENAAKDREIRRLNKDVQQYEQVIISLRNKIAHTEHHAPDVSKKDAEVMAEMSGNDCGDWEPVKDYSAMLRDETICYQNRIHKMEEDLKSSCDNVRTLRKMNTVLTEEMKAMRRICAALEEQCQVASARAQFKDEIIREMRRQLKQAKAKLKDASELNSIRHEKDFVSDKNEFGVGSTVSTYDSVTIECVRQQPRRKRGGSACESLKASTRHINDSSCQLITNDATVGTSDVYIIKRTLSAPIVISDDTRDIQNPQENIALNSNLHLTSRPETVNLASDRKNSSAKGEKSGHESAPESQSPREYACEDFQCLNTSKNATSNARESVCTSSEAGSTGGQCSAAARAQYYHDKLLATLQILQNSEETIRVQAESLRLAEARIAALTDRATEMRLDLTRKAHELRSLQTSMDDDKTEKTDVSITAEIQERKNVNIVSTLQSNLSVIEELYRECFYETAKQEELIDMLRDSCLDVRLLDRQKTEQIERLKSVVHSQKWSLDRCQDITMEVDNLKMEISNFLNNSSNDSGMWEREDSLATEVSEELLDITAQLLQLRDMLTADCTCGLQDENSRLKQLHDTMEVQMGELRQRMADLETTLADKQHLDDAYRQQIDFREAELEDLRQQLLTSEKGSKDQSTKCSTLTMQLQQTQVLLTDKTAELAEVQQRCTTQKHAIQLLKEELDRANQITQENAKIRTEVSQLTSQVSQWRSQLVESEQRLHLLENELQRARAHCRDVDHCYREKTRCAEVLRSQLEEARARGAELCEEARCVVSAVRRWARRMRETNRAQENKIKEQEIIISSLQHRLNDKHSDHSVHDSDPCCSKYIRREPSHLDTTEPSCSRAEERCEEMQRLSESEIASCSSAPIPPRRMVKKLPLCGDRRCSAGSSYRSWGEQRTPRRDAAGGAAPDTPDTPRCCHRHAHDIRHVRIAATPFPREVSPDELFERVDQLYEALDSGYRRWSRARPASHSR